jgi:hypothetical protein
MSEDAFRIPRQKMMEEIAGEAVLSAKSCRCASRNWRIPAKWPAPPEPEPGRRYNLTP